MKQGSISTALLAVACFASAALTTGILGPGIWSGALAVAGLVLAASPYVPAIQTVARTISLLGGILALLAVALGLLAATTGGAFRLPDDQAALLAALGVVGVLGIIVHRALRPRDDNT